MDRCGSLWIVVNHCGSFWIVVDRCESLWIIVDRCDRCELVTSLNGFFFTFLPVLPARLTVRPLIQVQFSSSSPLVSTMSPEVKTFNYKSALHEPGA